MTPTFYSFFYNYYDMKKVITDEIDIQWNKNIVKEYLWRPIQKTYLKKESTTKLSSDEFDKIYVILNRVIVEKTGVHVPFPCEEELVNQIVSDK